MRRETVRAAPRAHIICRHSPPQHQQRLEAHISAATTALTHERRRQQAGRERRPRHSHTAVQWPPRHSRGPPRRRAGRPWPPLPPRASSSATAPSSRRPRPASPPGAPRWPARPPASARARAGRAYRSSPWPAMVSEPQLVTFGIPVEPVPSLEVFSL